MNKASKLSVLIFLFLIVTVLYPILKMLFMVDWSTFGELISSNSFKISLNNSLLITCVSTVLSVCIAYIIAYTLNRTHIKHKAVLKLLLTLPMLIPSISHGLGLINLFGMNGIISRYFNFNIVGPVGIVVGSIIYSFPVALLMLDDGFKYIDNSMYDVAKVFGLNRFQTFTKVTMCYMKKPLLSSIFAVFTLVFTDYGVPLSVGGKFTTLPVFLYKEVIGLLDFSKGTLIGLFLLIPAIISFVFDTVSKDYSSAEVEGKEYNIIIKKFNEKLLTTFVYIVLIFIMALFLSFLYYSIIDNPILNARLSVKHFEYVVNNNIGRYAFNSLLIAVLVSIFGTIISYFGAYVTARVNFKLNRIIHLLMISSLAIPGIVLGLSYIVTFKSTIIYNTFIILVLVNIIHFIATPYLMAYNALKKVNQNYEIVAKTCNVSIPKIIMDVIIPCTKNTIREMFAYFFVNSMVTISAITFLFNAKTMPLSLLINNYEGNLMLGEAAIVSLTILLINIIVKIIIYIINRKEYRRKTINEFNL